MVADGATFFNGSGVTIQGGLAVNGTLALASPNNLAILGGNPGDVLVTNGAGVMSFAARVPEAPTDGQFYSRRSGAWAVAPGGMTDAPNDGTAYARKSQAWSHLTHADITDWAANVPASSSANPLVNGVAAPGSSAAFSRGDHVHPTDTSRAAVAALPPASTVLPSPVGVAAIGTSTAYARADHVHSSDGYAHDNRVINGDMRIDQRNNGATGTAIATYTVDHWYYQSNQANKGSWGRSTASNAIIQGAGFPYNLAFVSSSAYASLAADVFAFWQVVEADMISDFAWGTANAQPVTLSFWVQSSTGGTFSGSVKNAAGNRSYPFTFALVAATYTKVVVTILGDTAGTWVMNGNGGSLYLVFDLGCGSNARGPANAWASANYNGATGAASVVGTNGAGFNLTGVKLESGSVATPFNRQTLAKSQADCERYFRWLTFSMSFLATSTGQGMSAAVPFWPAMRAAPTIGGLAPDPNVTPSVANQSSLGFDTVTPYGARSFLTAISAGNCFVLGYRASATAEL